METPPDGLPQFLLFVRDWIYAPFALAGGWLWNEIRLVKTEQRDQLERIEGAVTRTALAVQQHQIDDLQRFASKDDLLLLRTDVNALRVHIDDRLDRLGDLVIKVGNGK